MYRTAVENYLTELKPLFLDDMTGKEYWYNLDLGEITIPLSENYNHIYGGNHKRIDLTGLQCIFAIPEPIVVEFDIIVESKGNWGDGVRSKTIQEKGNIPFDKLDTIVQSANQYLSERGFELDPEEETNPAQI